MPGLTDAGKNVSNQCVDHCYMGQAPETGTSGSHKCQNA